jgi:hypothetical protein
MGTYRHDYPQVKAATVKQWKAIREDVERLLSNLPTNSESAGGTFSHLTLALANGTGKPGTIPIVTDGEIALNGLEGIHDLSHESLWLTRAKNKVENADFCRTARKPYDLVVCAVLIVLQHQAPDVWQITTDGSFEDWEPAREWVEAVLDYPGFNELGEICKEQLATAVEATA